MPRRTPTFSISIEWENARFAELERTRRMLRELRRQLLALPPPARPPQINFLFDRRTIDSAMVESVIAAEFQPETVPAGTRIIPNEGLRYYEQKTFGARLYDGELTLFLDSDVVPEPGWLEAMLESFETADVGVVAGATYIECESFYSKAFALFWFFGLRDPAANLERATFFHANNCAFRSEVFLAHPFPDLPIYRGQCSVLCHRLEESGISIYLQKKARVAHPVPQTAWYFLARAMNNGRDEVLVQDLVARRNRPPLRTVFWNFRAGMLKSFRKIRGHARDVQLTPVAAVAAYAVALAYFGLKAMGELITHLRPNLVARLFPV
jgi:hypothetical protein